jgi:hypothetical protein
MNLEYIEAYLLERKCAASVELVGSRCEDECRKGPNLEINGQAFHGVNLEILAELLEQFVGKKAAEFKPDFPDTSLVVRHQRVKGIRK